MKAYPKDTPENRYPCQRCGQSHRTLEELRDCPGIVVSDDQEAFDLDELDGGRDQG